MAARQCFSARHYLAGLVLVFSQLYAGLAFAMPAAPSTPDLAESSDTCIGVVNNCGTLGQDNITTDTTPTFNGTAALGSTVNLFSNQEGGGTTVIGTGTADAMTGAWSITTSALTSTGQTGTVHSITATATDMTGTSLPSAALAVTIDTELPRIATAVRQSPTTSPTNADSVMFRYTFNETMVGIRPEVFNAANTTATVAVSPGVSTFTTVYDITLSGGDLPNSNGNAILGFVGGECLSTTCGDLAGNRLANVGPTGTNEQFYFFDNAPPQVNSIVVAGSPSGSDTSVQFTVTFNEAPTGVSTDDFSVTTTNTATGTVSGVSGTGTTRTVTVNTIGGDGSIRLDLNADTNIVDALGNGNEANMGGGVNGNTPAFAMGATHTVDNTAPTGYSVTIDQSPINAGNDDMVSFTFAGAEVGATYNYTFTSSGGAGSVTNSGTISTATDQITGIDASGLADGTITLSVTLTDTSGNTGSAAADTETKETVAPTGYSVVIDQSPINAGNDDAVSFTFAGAEVGAAYNYTFTSSGGAGSVTGSGTIATATDQITGIDVSGLADGTITLSVTLTDTNGNTGSAATDTETKDAGAPMGYSVVIDQSPINVNNEDAVSFTFASAEVGATYNYTFSSNGGGTNVMGSGTIATATDQITGIDLSGLGDGTITLNVALTDVNGNNGSITSDTETKETVAPTGYSVTVDQTPINAGNDDAVSFTFAGAEVGATYNYTFTSSGGMGSVTGSGTISTATDQITSIDVSGLPDGTITLSVTLTDTNGNTGSAATDTETKETVAPTGYSITIDQSPINVSNEDAVSFTFASAEVGAGYNYSFTSSGGAGSVTGSGTISTATDQITGIDISGLPNGTITLSVTLTDTNGNTGTAATDTETKDAAAPTGYGVTIDQSPINASNANTVNFTFASAEVGATYNYTFTSSGGAGSVTGSGTISTATDQITSIDLRGLADGTITLSVTLTDTNSNTGTPATDTETKDTMDPTGYSVTIDQSPINSGNDDSVSFTFAGAEVGATYNYTFTSDGGMGAITGSGTVSTATDQITGIDISSLSDGSISLGVTLTDVNGNLGAPTLDTETKETVAPTGYSVAIDQSPINLSNEDAVSFTFAGAEVGATYNYTLSSTGGGTNVTGSGTIATATDQISSIDLSGLGDGTITLNVSLTDTNGNTGTSATDTESKDVAGPTVSIGAPSAANADQADTVTFTVTYSGASAVTLANGNVSLNTTGTGVNADVAVSGTGTTTRTVTLTNIVGDGTVGITIASGTATDASNNSAPASSDSATVNVDNTAPAVSLVGSISTVDANSDRDSLSVSVMFSDLNNISTASIDSSDLTVTGPSGNVAIASAETFTIDANSGTETYNITPPGGSWDAADNGGYTIALNASQVTDELGNANVANASFASFIVNIDAQAQAIVIIGENVNSDNMNGGSTTDYTNAGVTGVTDGNVLTLINNAIATVVDGEDVDTTAEIQTIVNAILEGQDDDGDSLPNLFEGPSSVDSDGDGIANRDDSDSDNDGISDQLETNLNQTDSDNDGIIDIFDADVGNNGEVDASIVDANLDGVSDNLAQIVQLLSTNSGDTDLDGIANVFDADADGDSSVDIGVVDTTPANGIIDALQEAYSLFLMINGDSDIAPNHLDLDSDNDGLTDVSESSDVNRDVDGDAFVDAGQDLITDAMNLRDTDMAAMPSLPDYLDKYSGDATDAVANSRDILTSPEFGSTADTLDANMDGEIDDRTDMDNDGLVDAVDNFTTGFGANNDIDGDGIPNDDDLNPNGIDVTSSSGVLANGLWVLFGLLSLVIGKSRKLITAIVLTIAATTSMADDHGVEWQVGVGQTEFDLESPINFTRERDAQVSFSLGYRFHENWLVQYRYSDLGTQRANATQLIEAKANSLNVQATLPILEEQPISVYSLIGLTALDYDNQNISIEDDAPTELQLGLGIKGDIEKVTLGLELTSYGADLWTWSAILGSRF